MAAAGFALGGMAGFSAALIGWAAIVAAATAIVFLHKAFCTPSGTAEG